MSTSSSKAGNLPARLAGWLLGASILALSGSALSTPFDEHLEGILQKATPGVVRIEVQRPWSTVFPGTLAALGGGAPVLRILGNGVVWDAQGHILTVCDLAQPGDTLHVYLASGERGTADFIGQDAETGLSLILVRGLAALEPIERGSSGPAMKDEEWVLTLGWRARSHASGLALARVRSRVQTGNVSRVRLEGRGDAGLAGSGVLDGEGRLIGVLLGEGNESVMFGAGRREGRQGFDLDSSGPTEAGWVLPIEAMERSARMLLAEGRSGQGFLGVRVDVERGGEGRLDSSATGLSVARVLPGSPAAIAGIRAGDRIVAFDSHPVLNWDQLTRQVGATPPLQSVAIDLLRDGHRLSLAVRLGDRGSMVWREKQRALFDGRERQLRKQIEDLNQQLRLMRPRGDSGP